MKTLHLTLKKKWFDMVGNGKPEEYREISEWSVSRLLKMIRNLEMKQFSIQYSDLKNAFAYLWGYKGSKLKSVEFLLLSGCADFQDYDNVCFTNGYRKDSKRKTFVFDGVELRTGNPEWGAEPGKTYFVIKLGAQIL